MFHDDAGREGENIESTASAHQDRAIFGSPHFDEIFSWQHHRPFLPDDPAVADSKPARPGLMKPNNLFIHIDIRQCV
jgi:hypothetical protein